MSPWLSMFIPLLALFFMLGMESLESRVCHAQVRHDGAQPLVQLPRKRRRGAALRPAAFHHGHTARHSRFPRPRPPGQKIKYSSVRHEARLYRTEVRDRAPRGAVIRVRV